MPVLECLSLVPANSPSPWASFSLQTPLSFSALSMWTSLLFLIFTSLKHSCPRQPSPPPALLEPWSLPASPALLAACPLSPDVCLSSFSFFLFLFQLLSCHLPPTHHLLLLLAAVPCPLYKEKPFHLIYSPSFLPGAAAVVLFLGTAFSLAPKRFITELELNVRPESAFLYRAPLGLCRGSACPQCRVFVLHSCSTCCACGRGWLGETAAVLRALGHRRSCLGRVAAVLPFRFLIKKKSRVNKAVHLVFA